MDSTIKVEPAELVKALDSAGGEPMVYFTLCSVLVCVVIWWLTRNYENRANKDREAYMTSMSDLTETNKANTIEFAKTIESQARMSQDNEQRNREFLVSILEKDK